jgi:hypothetical protein
MGKEEDPKRKLRPVKGERPPRLSVGAVEIFVAPPSFPPYPVDAVVAEEDTFLVLSADPEFVECHENPGRVMTEAFETPPAEPGSVIVQKGPPLRLLAVVHDLNQDPSWKEEWVASALEGIFHEAERRNLRSLALPLLGTLHGSLEKKRFMALLRGAMEQTATNYPRRLWLVVPEGTALEMKEMLAAELMRNAEE